MCRHFLLSTPLETLQTRFQFTGGVAYPPRAHIRPPEPVCVIRLRPGVEATGVRELALVRWGLLPHWVKDPQTFGSLPNARAETVPDKPSFKTPMRHRRCLVPADGWYVTTGDKPSRRVLHRVTPAAADEPIMFAGLWDHWLGADGSEIETLAIVTAPAIAPLAHLDERMPVVLAPAQTDAWLDVRGTSPDEAAELLSATDQRDWTVTDVSAPH